MPILLTRHHPLRLCAPEIQDPSSSVRSKMTKSLPQQAKQPAVAIQTKATLRTTQCGGSLGVVYGAMGAPPSVSAMGNAPTTFDPPHKLEITGESVVALQAASFPPATTNVKPQDASTVGKAPIDWSIETVTKVGHGPQLFNVTATGTAGGTAAMSRRRCHASPLALVFLALVLFCGVDGGWAVFTPTGDSLDAAVHNCLSEHSGGRSQSNGSCPIFSASIDAATGNPYGVMGDWNVSQVTSLKGGTSTPSSFSLVCCIFHLNFVLTPHCFFLRFHDFPFCWIGSNHNGTDILLQCSKLLLHSTRTFPSGTLRR